MIMSISIDGLMSGLDYTSIIEQLIEIERRPIQKLNSRIEEANSRKVAFMDLSARLLGLQSNMATLASSKSYGNTTVASTNENVLAVSGDGSVPEGSYTFRVARLARNEQMVSSGFADKSLTPVGAGDFTIEMGPAYLDRTTRLSFLNQQNGVERGSIKITDRLGQSATVDLTTASDMGEAIRLINNGGTGIRASVEGDHLVLTDTSGGAGNLKVEEVGTTTTAADLGILGSVAADTLTGSDVNSISVNTSLEFLNDGRGIRMRAGEDFTISTNSAENIDVNISGSETVGDIIDAINNDAENGGRVTASLVGKHLQLVDNTVGVAGFSVTTGTSQAAADLGIETSVAGNTIDGGDIVASLNSVLISSLKGGSGITDGSFRITDKSGASQVFDMSNYQSLQEMLDDISSSAIINVTASLNDARNGILVTDDTGLPAGNLVIQENGSTVAAELGILGSSSEGEISGSSLDLAYVGEMTRLDTLNGGEGVYAGRFRITDADGNTAIINLEQEDDVYIEDVISEINASGTNVTASLNATGNGLLLVDSSAGTGTFRIDEEGGSTARDLNIAGSHASGTVDGAFKRTITLDANDTLEDLKSKINELDLGIKASIINDGTGTNPYRLSLMSENAGKDGRMVVDGSGVGFEFTTTSRAQDSALVLGDPSTGAEPIIIESSKNTLSDVIEGMTISMLAVSENPVTITASTDDSKVVDSVASFVENYNKLVDTIDELTDFNTETMERGILLGDGTVRSIQSELRRMVTTPVSGLDSDFNTLRAVGISFSGKGKLVLDQAKLENAVLNDPDRVADLFGLMKSITNTTKLDDFNEGAGVAYSTSGPEFKITRRDGVEMEIDIDTADTVEDLLDIINNHANNADGKLQARISSDGRRLEIEDYTGGAGDLRTTSMENAKTLSNLGLAYATESATLVGREIDLSGNPGVAQRMLEKLEYMTKMDGGLVATATGKIDQQIELYNEQIERLEDHVKHETERLQKQFVALEQMLAQSQSTMDWLSSNLLSMSGNSSGKKK